MYYIHIMCMSWCVRHWGEKKIIYICVCINIKREDEKRKRTGEKNKNEIKPTEVCACAREKDGARGAGTHGSATPPDS